VLTNTEGINYRDVSYAKYCSGKRPEKYLRIPTSNFPHVARALPYADDGAAQHAARALEEFGINATDNSIPGKAAVLRTGEAIDAVNSAIHSANAEIPLESAGYLMCSIVQLGGILYGTLVVVGALVLLSLYPLCNCCGRFFFDILCFSVVATQRNSPGGDNYDRVKEMPPAADTIQVLDGTGKQTVTSATVGTTSQRFLAGMVNVIDDARRRRGGLGTRWNTMSPPDSPEEHAHGELSGLLASRGQGQRLEK